MTAASSGDFAVAAESFTVGIAAISAQRFTILTRGRDDLMAMLSDRLQRAGGELHGEAAASHASGQETVASGRLDPAQLQSAIEHFTRGLERQSLVEKYTSNLAKAQLRTDLEVSLRNATQQKREAECLRDAEVKLGRGRAAGSSGNFAEAANCCTIGIAAISAQRFTVLTSERNQLHADLERWLTDAQQKREAEEEKRQRQKEAREKRKEDKWWKAQEQQAKQRRGSGRWIHGSPMESVFATSDKPVREGPSITGSQSVIGRQGRIQVRRVDRTYIAAGISGGDHIHCGLVLKGLFHVDWLNTTFMYILLHRLDRGLVLRGMNEPSDARAVMEAYIGCDSMDGSFRVQRVQTASQTVDMDGGFLQRLGALINSDLQLSCVVRPSDVAESFMSSAGGLHNLPDLPITNCCIFVAKALAVLGVPLGDIVLTVKAACRNNPELEQFVADQGIDNLFSS